MIPLGWGKEAASKEASSSIWCDGMVERYTGTVSAAMQALYQIVVVKRELSRKAKLLICQTHLRSKPHLWS